MALRMFNSLTSDKQDFVPLLPGRVGIYVCGITVYDLPHIGHARMLCAFDTAVRFLRWSGWQVKYVRNWTDASIRQFPRHYSPVRHSSAKKQASSCYRSTCMC